MSIKTTISFALITAAFMGCEQNAKLNNLHDATLEMRDTTKSVDKTSNRMSEQVGEQLEISESLNKKIDSQLSVSEEMNSGLKEQLDVSDDMNAGLKEQLGVSKEMNSGLKEQLKVSNDISDSTNELYDALRQGDALQLRRSAWDRIIESKDFARKISESGKYFMSYEFQLWTGKGKDGGAGSIENQKEQREVLFQQAAREFFMDIQEFYIVGIVDPLGGQDKIFGNTNDTKEQKLANFNALSVSMDQLNRKQSNAVKALGVPEKSMYDLIKEALSERTNPSAKASVGGSTYIEEILLQEPVAWQLIQARHNTFAMVILAQLTDLKSPVNQGLKSLAGWDLDISKMNPSQKKLIASYIALMQESIKFLGANQHQITVDKKIAKLWKNMRVINAQAKDADTAAVVNQILSYKAWLSKAFPK